MLRQTTIIIRGCTMIYLVEDDDSIRELVVYTLNSVGFEAVGFSLPSKFFDALNAQSPELVLLDIMLPEEDGLSILKKLKGSGKTSQIPVMMLTAKDTEYDKVKGFDLGADDYMSKPFGMMELVARVKALLRRYAKTEAPKTDEFVCGALSFSASKHSVSVLGESVTLTLKEFELLHTLIINRGQVMTRDQLLDAVWGYSFEGESRTLDVHIRTLRKKLGEAGDMVETVRGVGYIIQ